MAILVRGLIPEKSSHCSPLQPTLTWQFQAGGISSNVLPLQPKSYIILPALNKLPPHSYINLPPIDELPPLLQQNGWILGRTFDPGILAANSL